MLDVIKRNFKHFTIKIQPYGNNNNNNHMNVAL